MGLKSCIPGHPLLPHHLLVHCNMLLPEQDVSKDSVDKNEQSAYWYHRYSLRPLLDPQGHVALTPTGAPLFDVPLLLAEAQETILMTGKYLNAIRECGRTVERSLPADVHVGESLALVMCT